MSNPYFQFKQFTIHQDRCAMKVCTDACLFGAWSSQRIPDGARVLDIGSGTGLLMLMLAQRHSGGIQGIELDAEAFAQLQENIGQSPWSSRLRVSWGDVRDFVFPDKFGFIICNPPFFEDDLPAATGAKNLAKHGHALKLSELIRVIDANLGVKGSFGILLPTHREGYFVELAGGHGFYLAGRLGISQREGQEYFRSIMHFSRHPADLATYPAELAVHSTDLAIYSTDLAIYREDGGYTPEFVELLKDYYLYL